MKIRVVYNFILFRKWGWIGGMVLYPFILFKRKKEEISDTIFRHEMEHIYQVRRIGWFKYYLTYLWYAMRHKYEDIPYEVQARAVQHEPLTDEERKLKDTSGIV